MGGAESRVMDIARHIDKNKICFDFLLDEPPGFYEPEALELGCRIYRVPRFRFFNWFQYAHAMNRFFAEHKEIDIVQGSLTSTASIYMPIAKKNGVPVTMGYARSAGVDPGPKGWLTRYLRRDLFHKCDIAAAVSSEAGDSVYGKGRSAKGEVMIIPDSFELDKFIPDADKTERGLAIRKRYGLEDAFVVGHIGRFHYAKNHEFLLKIFAKIREKKENARLLLAGTGPLFDAVKKQASSMGIEKDVVFAGQTDEPEAFYQAFDVFIFPSRYEGLPGTVIEAQTAGVPCLMSDTITKEAAVTDLVRVCKLDKSADIWADEACDLYGMWKEKYGDKGHASRIDDLKKAGFDVKTEAVRLEELYAKLLNDSGINRQ